MVLGADRGRPRLGLRRRVDRSSARSVPSPTTRPATSTSPPSAAGLPTTIDLDAARRAALADLALADLPGEPVGPPIVEAGPTPDTIVVEVTRDIPHIFGRAVPGVPRTERITVRLAGTIGEPRQLRSPGPEERGGVELVDGAGGSDGGRRARRRRPGGRPCPAVKMVAAYGYAAIRRCSAQSSSAEYVGPPADGEGVAVAIEQVALEIDHAARRRGRAPGSR